MATIESTIRFLNVTGFLNQYIKNHISTGGVTNVRLCTLNTSFQTILPDSEEAEKLLERIELCMCDAPANGTHWEICAWIYSNGSVYPTISHGDTGGEYIQLTILNHLAAMAGGHGIVAFEVTFYDLHPDHKWFFLAE
jgi:hypothetical protein